MSNQYVEILDSLNVGDDTSNNKFEITSLSLSSGDLTTLGVRHDNTKEGVNVKLDAQTGFRIYKTKQDALTSCILDSFNKDILIIEGCKIWEQNRDNQDEFIENIKLWHEYNKLLAGIADYKNSTDKEFVLLSPDKGKLEVGFSEKPIDYFSSIAFNQKTFKDIEKLINGNEDYISFLKDAFIDKSCQEPKENRFSYAIKNIDIILDNANRDYNLYKNKFSFKEFSEGLEYSKNKYLKDYQLFLSDFLSKISNLPIQVGIYIFLIYRFSDAIYVLLSLLVLIFILFIYSSKNISLMIDNIKEIKDSFIHNINSIQKESGANKQDFLEIKAKLTVKLDKFIGLLVSYKYVNIAANILFVIIILYYIICNQ